MPTSLPPLADLAGSGNTPTSDVFRAAIGAVRTFLAEKLGVSGTNSDAQTALGASAMGKSVFSVANELALAKLLGAGSVAANPVKIKVLLGLNHQMQIGSNLVTTDAAGLATIIFPEQFFAKTGEPENVKFAMVSLGDITSMSPIAAVALSYTSTTMQIKCAASTTIRVNWLAVAEYPIVVYPEGP